MTRNLHEYRALRIEVLHPLSWLFSQDYGAYVVRLLGNSNNLHQSNEHVICSDAIAKEIIDCVETCAMRLIYEEISCLVGDNFDLNEFTDIRFIHHQPKMHLKVGKEALVQQRNGGSSSGANGKINLSYYTHAIDITFNIRL